jgi:hypothetical protein
MLTHTLPSPDLTPNPSPSERGTEKTENTESPEFIQRQVDERGFYLYEWISSDELRITLERDYLTIVKWASIPLAVITAIAGFVGFAG